MLAGKKIIVGVTGSIAAYKSALLIRLLIQSRAEVRVVMTPSALDFITPLTLATLSKNPVLHQFSNPVEGTWNNHVELGLWANACIIAPASANTLSAAATGRCDNLLQAVYLSARCPVFFAPAMDADMIGHPTTKENISKLKSFGNIIIEPGHGELASGLEGPGRMAEPSQIIDQVSKHLEKLNSFKGKKVLVTAGPTYEALDPVRFIGNHSTGKMGYALAEALASRGAEVKLVSGPSSLECAHPRIELIRCTSAQEMDEHCRRIFPEVDIAILSAAVADYRAKSIASEKIKKTENSLILELEKTPDIAAGLGSIKKSGQYLMGFALETEHELEHAREKLLKKNFDAIALNSLRDSGAGFGYDTNKITLLARDGGSISYDLKPKREVASDIVNFIFEKIHV